MREKSKLRKSNNEFLIEGKREIKLAVQGGYTIEKILFNRDLHIDIDAWLNELDINSSIECYELSKEVYEKLAVRSSTEGVLAVAKCKEHTLDKINLKNKNSLILIAESPEKPGNIGALLRTADASGVDAVIISNPKGDLYNPNVIRSSIGCLFTIPVFIADNQSVYDFLRENNIKSFAAVLDHNSKIYDQVSYKDASAVLVGTEADGLSSFWFEHADHKIMIPMKGVIDSMNVSVAASILIFEAIRQRKI